MVITAVLVLSGIVFGAGLVTTFAGTRLRGRIAGLVTMAVAALTSLGASNPTRADTWWMVAAGGLTLLGLVGFAVALGRWAATGPDDDLAIDEEPL
jgi:hypothetical protein